MDAGFAYILIPILDWHENDLEKCRRFSKSFFVKYSKNILTNQNLIIIIKLGY